MVYTVLYKANNTIYSVLLFKQKYLNNVVNLGEDKIMEINDKGIILYSTGCPKCRVIENKLIEKNIKFQKVNDKEEMIKKDILNVPVLEIGNTIMGFVEANTWINNYSA